MYKRQSQTIRQVLISTQQSGNVKVTKAVIKKLVADNVRTEEGVSLRGIKILATDHGLSLLIVLKVDGRNVRQTTDYLKNLLQDVFKNLLHMVASCVFCCTILVLQQKTACPQGGESTYRMRTGTG